MTDRLLAILSGIRPESDFRASMDFIEDGMLDSFDVVTLVSELEEQYQVSIDGVDIIPENFRNLATLRRLLEKSRARP